MTVEDTRRLVLTVVALGLVQLAWILAIAPFGGLDEPQHVFKAEAVARGDLSPHHSPAPDGVGQLLVVPDDIAAAAHPACVLDQSRTQAGCRGTDLGSGTRVASTAATYNPVYYAVVGAVALPFDGTAALYAMRAWSALLCGVITALAITLLVRRRRGSTLLTASLLVLSPIWAYTSVVVAPNGLEMATAFLLWGCLLRLGSTDPLPLPRRWLVVLATSSAALLVTLRTLGPLWCAVIVVVCAVVADPGRLRSAVAAPGARRAATADRSRSGSATSAHATTITAHHRGPRVRRVTSRAADDVASVTSQRRGRGSGPVDPRRRRQAHSRKAAAISSPLGATTTEV